MPLLQQVDLRLRLLDLPLQPLPPPLQPLYPPRLELVPADEAQGQRHPQGRGQGRGGQGYLLLTHVLSY